MLDGNNSKPGKKAHGDPENRIQSKSSASGKNNLPEKNITKGGTGVTKGDNLIADLL